MTAEAPFVASASPPTTPAAMMDPEINERGQDACIEPPASAWTAESRDSHMVCQELNGVVVFRPRGHLYEGAEVDHLETGLGYMLEGGVHEVVVSLIEVGHLSARAVGVMASAHALAQRKGGHLVVSGARPEHREVFRITGLTGVLDVRDSQPPAITPFDGFRAAVA